MEAVGFLLFLVIAPGRCSRLQASSLDGNLSQFKDAAGKLFVRSIATEKEVKLSYSKIPIPTLAEACDFEASLRSVPREGSADVSEAVDGSMRFALLSYARNDGQRVQVRALDETAIELQLHGTEAYDAGAHMVAYLYRLEAQGEIGVVLSYKGSTLNSVDWRHNLNVLTSRKDKQISSGKYLFPAAAQYIQEKVRAKVHAGFLAYKDSLDVVMQSVDMSEIFAAWRFPGRAMPSAHVANATSFYDWLQLPGSWRWCVIVGHSLGGAMASIAAADLAVRSNRQVMLATVGSPIAGNAAFRNLVDRLVEPAGGLRIRNKADTVTSLGHGGVRSSGMHAGRKITLKESAWTIPGPYSVHLFYRIPSKIHGHNEWLATTFYFPGLTYMPTAVNDLEFFNLVHYPQSRLLLLGGVVKVTKTGCRCQERWITEHGSCMGRYCCNPGNSWKGNWCVVVDPQCQAGKTWDFCAAAR